MWILLIILSLVYISFTLVVAMYHRIELFAICNLHYNNSDNSDIIQMHDPSNILYSMWIISGLTKSNHSLLLIKMYFDILKLSKKYVHLNMSSGSACFCFFWIQQEEKNKRWIHLWKLSRCTSTINNSDSVVSLALLKGSLLFGTAGLGT